MTISAHRLALLAALGSTGLLAGAFLFQFLGWAPCTLCLWQRWPHAAAALVGAMILASGQITRRRGASVRAGLAPLGLLSAAAATALAAYHSGVELKWWPGPATCSGGAGLSALSPDQLLPGALATGPALVMCDAITPFFMGLTMANWNFIASLALAGLWTLASLKRPA